MITEYKIAVLDIGKTNKKLVLYDQDLKMIAGESTVIEEYEKNNIRHDNLDKIEKWIIRSLRKFARSYPDIMSISITTHGATFVCLDEKGNVCLPEISYTTDPGDEFHKEFYNEFGDRKILQQSTATPDFNLLINPGKGIWFASRKYPEKFSKIKCILNYPQYFGYRLTGETGVEPTYTGCHTYLWDFVKNDWSEVAKKMGLKRLFPGKMKRPWDILGRIKTSIARQTGLNENTTVTLGIHDSNASLLPYMVTMKEDFVLNSTGTWCVIMHEKEKVEFRDDELGKVVFYNINAFSRPVKTAIFMGGLEFQHYINILKKLDHKDRYPEFNSSLYEKIIRDRVLFILPSVSRGTGQFPDSEPRIIENEKNYSYDEVNEGKSVPGFFHDYETAYAVLILSLVIQTKVSLERADMSDGLPLFIEGGFSNNDSYTKLLASLYPASETFITSLNEATAFGAALLSKASVEDLHPSQLGNFIDLKKFRVAKTKLSGFSEYISDYLGKI